MDLSLDFINHSLDLRDLSLDLTNTSLDLMNLSLDLINLNWTYTQDLSPPPKKNENPYLGKTPHLNTF